MHRSSHIIYIYIYIYIKPTLLYKQDVTQGQILSGVYQVWLQSFPSPRLVAIPRLKSPIRPTTLSIAEGGIVGWGY